MKVDNINNMFKGWFIGNFEPSLLKTDEFEVAVKNYKAGESEKSHYHKIATEYTVIVFGKVRMNGVEYNLGDIIIMEPGEPTDFEALEDCSTVVVKVPCSKNDKYII